MERFVTGGLCALSALLFIVLNGVHAAILTPAANGLKAPDLVPLGYDLPGLTAWLQAMEIAEREQFIGIHSLTLDLIFPFVLTWTLYRLYGAVLARLPRFSRQRGVVKILFILAMVLPYLVFDIVENSTVLAMLSQTGLPDSAAAAALQTWTALKYAAVTFAFISLAAFWLAGRQREPVS